MEKLNIMAKHYAKHLKNKNLRVIQNGEKRLESIQIDL